MTRGITNEFKVIHHDGASPSNHENTIYPLSRWREKAGVRVDMISGFSPSPILLSPRGEELRGFIFYVNYQKD